MQAKLSLTRVMAIGALCAAVPLVVGFGVGKQADGFGAEIDQMEKVVKAVRTAYKGCENPKASVVMAELGIHELGKKGRIQDAPARLEKALEQIEDQDLQIGRAHV